MKSTLILAGTILGMSSAIALAQSPPCTELVECAQLALQAAQTAQRAATIATPSGAVLAFNRSSCPDGWSQFAPASGRFVLGTAANIALGTRRGRADIPTDGAHEHGVRGGRAPGGGRFGNDNNDDHWATSTAGSHNHGGNNMPPYVALLYCVRD